jgi:hypothetical protein
MAPARIRVQNLEVEVEYGIHGSGFEDLGDPNRVADKNQDSVTHYEIVDLD